MNFANFDGFGHSDSKRLPVEDHKLKGDTNMSELYDLYVVRSNGPDEWYALSIWAIGDRAIYSGPWLNKRNEDPFDLKMHREEVADLERFLPSGQVTKLCTRQSIDECRRTLRREWKNL